MSTRLTGRLLSETFDGTQAALADCHVTVRNNGVLFGKQIGSDVTDASGNFSVSYSADMTAAPSHRQLEIVVEDKVGRALPVARANGQAVNPDPGRPVLSDVADDVLPGGDFIVMDGNARGWLVTLGTGRAAETRPPNSGEANPPAASGHGLSQGNIVKLLIDNEAFPHIAEKFQAAQSSILMSQLFFSVPKEYKSQALLEKPSLIFKFHAPAPKATDTFPWHVNLDDLRPERLLIDAARRGVDVRMVMHDVEVPLFFRILVGALVFPFLTIAGSLWVIFFKLGVDLTDADELVRYFTPANADAGPNHPNAKNIKVRAFGQNPVTAGVMHAKLGVIDEQHAFCIGSPFGQSYVDTHDHNIDEPQRGGSDGLPKHDIGFAVTGPAVADIRQILRLLWNEAARDPADRVRDDPDPPAVPPAQTGPGVCSVQIVRTLTANRFPGLPLGEKGILEGYLRAIGEAERFIYFETQYFTDDPIGRALIAAMKRNPNLQVILLVNIAPDVPFYPIKQRRLITRIREAIGETKNGERQFGVYTRWTHAAQPFVASEPNLRPRMAPVYVHAKTGVIDDKWATIGSANLDGLSLDSYMLSDILNWLPGLFNFNPFDEQRAIEINGNFFNNVAGQPASDIVVRLRCKLWAEHLTFLNANNEPDPLHPSVTQSMPSGGWLPFWQTRAEATRTRLINAPRDPLGDLARILPWPDEDETFKTPRTHLHALKILRQLNAPTITPLKAMRTFDFKNGDWTKDSKAEVDD